MPKCDQLDESREEGDEDGTGAKEVARGGGEGGLEAGAHIVDCGGGRSEDHLRGEGNTKRPKMR